MGTALICAARYQRRRARTSPPSDNPLRGRYLTLTLAQPSRFWKQASKVYGRVGWTFALCGAAELIRGTATALG